MRNIWDFFRVRRNRSITLIGIWSLSAILCGTVGEKRGAMFCCASYIASMIVYLWNELQSTRKGNP